MDLPAAIHKDEDSVYRVSVPEVPGCHSWGTLFRKLCLRPAKPSMSFRDADRMGEEIDLRASDVDALRGAPEFEGAIWAVVHVDPEGLGGTPEHINISVSRSVLKKTDR